MAPRPLWQELPGPSGHKLRLLDAGGRVHADRSPGPPQDPRGGFRKMWARIHADRSPWATSGPAGRFQEDVAPRPLWQELPGPSGPKLRLLDAGGRIHSDRGPGLLRTRGEGSPGGAAVWRLPLAQGAILETRDRIPHPAPGAQSLLLPPPVSLPLSLSVTIINK